MSDVTKGRKPVIAGLIDPLLFEGGHTVRQIADLVRNQLVTMPGFSKWNGKMVNNIETRIHLLRKRGVKVTRDEFKRVLAVKL